MILIIFSSTNPYLLSFIIPFWLPCITSVPSQTFFWHFILINHLTFNTLANSPRLFFTTLLSIRLVFLTSLYYLYYTSLCYRCFVMIYTTLTHFFSFGCFYDLTILALYCLLNCFMGLMIFKI